MVASTVDLARTLGLAVTAEGIESAAVRDHLAAAGVHWAQGWLYSPALPAPARGAAAHAVGATRDLNQGQARSRCHTSETGRA